MLTPLIPTWECSRLQAGRLVVILLILSKKELKYVRWHLVITLLNSYVSYHLNRHFSYERRTQKKTNCKFDTGRGFKRSSYKLKAAIGGSFAGAANFRWVADRQRFLRVPASHRTEPISLSRCEPWSPKPSTFIVQRQLAGW